MTARVVVGTCICLQLEASLVTKVEDPEIFLLEVQKRAKVMAKF
jgi:hypothetical protein